MEKFKKHFFSNPMRTAFTAWILVSIIAAPIQFYIIGLSEIRASSKNHFGVDISSQFSFLEVARSAGYSFWRTLITGIPAVFIPVAIISKWGLEYRREQNFGWRRIFLSITFVLPVCAVIFSKAQNLLELIFFNIIMPMAFGILLVKFFTWIRQGFEKNESAQKNELK